MKKEYDLGKMKVRSRGRTEPEAAKVPISIRLDGNVLAQLRDEADKAGIPYQTFVSSILYRYVSGGLQEMNGKRDRDMIRKIVRATLEELEE